MSQATVTVGTMNFGARTPSAEARRIVDRALDRGLRHFDTANAYGDGESERILGTALKGRRDQVEIATKVGFANREGLSKARVLAALDESLERLRVDYVDLYYLHVPDPKTLITETLEAISTLLRNGKIKAWGVSNYASWQIFGINMLCDSAGMKRPAVSQVLYNLLVRQLDIEYFKFTRANPIHTTVYNVLAGGMLAGGHRGDKNPMYKKRYWNQTLFSLAEQYRALAQKHGLDVITFAHAWAAGHPGVDSILAGPASVEHLDLSIDACAKELPPQARNEADEIHRAYLGTDASYAR